MRTLFQEFGQFFSLWASYFSRRARIAFLHFEQAKDFLVAKLTFGRGRLTRPFTHSGMAALVILGVALTPLIASSYSSFGTDSGQENNLQPAVLSAVMATEQTSTVISEKPRAEIIEYKVEGGDTVSGIAAKFGISIDTIRWANDLKSISSIKPGQTLKILPVTGIAHKVQKGETIYSIAKHYSSGPQAVVDFPFNVFVNDETFSLAVGQIIIVPDGSEPKQKPWSGTAYIAQRTPDAGAVSATGSLVWPASGGISQRFVWYHKGMDIANKSAPAVLAADSGRVVTAGWPDNRGYGNRVLIDHGNGYQTRYAHLSRIYVTAGQTVQRGAQIGQMGSTGRSTGTHLHFEIYKNGVAQNPLNYLK